MGTSSTRREPRRVAILAVIVVSYLMIGIDVSIVNIALPTIRTALGFSSVTLSWVINAYLLTYGGLLFLGGRSGDIAGRRRTLFAGISIFTAASALGGFAPTVWWLLAARALQGVGAALIAPSTMALLASNFPEGEARNRALSVYTTAASFGVTIGLLLGGVLTGLLSWRWVFYVNLPFGIALLCAIPRLLRETESRAGQFDLPGGIASTLGITSLVYALISGASVGLDRPQTVGALLAAVALLGFFLVHERRSPHPLLPLSLLRDRNRIAAYLCLLLIVAGNFGMFFFATQFLQGVLQFTPVQTGLAYLPMALSVMATVRIVPRLLKRFEPRTLILAGTPLQAVAIGWLSRLSPATGYFPGIFFPMLLTGLAWGLCTISLTTLALAGVEPHESGAASGLTQTMISVGGSFGLAMLVTVFGFATRQGAASETLFVHGTRLALLVAALLAAGAFLAALTLIRARKRMPGAKLLAGPDRSKSIARRYFEMLNTGETATASEILHPRWMDHAYPDLRGVGEAANRLAEIGLEHPRVTIERMVSDGEHVAVHGTIHRRINGTTRRSRVMWFIRMEDDRMAEMWTAHEQPHRSEVAEPLLT